VTWNEPIENGSPITAYKILIKQKDLITFKETLDCVGTINTIVASRTCLINLTTLRASPLILVKGDSIIAQIISVNAYGDSVQVVTGSGAVVRDVPDAPVSLLNDPTITTDKVIKFTWADGASDGGTPVIDYTVSYDQGTNTFV